MAASFRDGLGGAVAPLQLLQDLPVHGLQRRLLAVGVQRPLAARPTPRCYIQGNVWPWFSFWTFPRKPMRWCLHYRFSCEWCTNYSESILTNFGGAYYNRLNHFCIQASETVRKAPLWHELRGLELPSGARAFRRLRRGGSVRLVQLAREALPRLRVRALQRYLRGVPFAFRQNGGVIMMCTSINGVFNDVHLFQGCFYEFGVEGAATNWRADLWEL